MMLMWGRIVSGANNEKKKKTNSNWLKQTDKRFVISHNEKPKPNFRHGSIQVLRKCYWDMASSISLLYFFLNSSRFCPLWWPLIIWASLERRISEHSSIYQGSRPHVVQKSHCFSSPTSVVACCSTWAQGAHVPFKVSALASSRLTVSLLFPGPSSSPLSGRKPDGLCLRS